MSLWRVSSMLTACASLTSSTALGDMMSDNVLGKKPTSLELVLRPLRQAFWLSAPQISGHTSQIKSSFEIKSIKKIRKMEAPQKRRVRMSKVKGREDKDMKQATLKVGRDPATERDQGGTQLVLWRMVALQCHYRQQMIATYHPQFCEKL